MAYDEDDANNEPVYQNLDDEEMAKKDGHFTIRIKTPTKERMHFTNLLRAVQVARERAITNGINVCVHEVGVGPVYIEEG
jgi:hypothetical protein